MTWRVFPCIPLSAMSRARTRLVFPWITWIIIHLQSNHRSCLHSHDLSRTVVLNSHVTCFPLKYHDSFFMTNKCVQITWWLVLLWTRWLVFHPGALLFQWAALPMLMSRASSLQQAATALPFKEERYRIVRGHCKGSSLSSLTHSYDLSFPEENELSFISSALTRVVYYLESTYETCLEHSHGVSFLKYHDLSFMSTK